MFNRITRICRNVASRVRGRCVLATFGQMISHPLSNLSGRPMPRWYKLGCRSISWAPRSRDRLGWLHFHSAQETSFTNQSSSREGIWLGPLANECAHPLNNDASITRPLVLDAYRCPMPAFEQHQSGMDTSNESEIVSSAHTCTNRL